MTMPNPPTPLGTYNVDADYNGYPCWWQTGTDFRVWYADSDNKYICSLYTVKGHVAPTDCWERLGTDPMGSYYAHLGGSYTGDMRFV